jgi:hypothetical protein
MRTSTAFVSVALLVAPVSARRGQKCRPESRCVNSPDNGLHQSSQFLPLDNLTHGLTVTSGDRFVYQDGMRYAKPGTLECLYGHTDLDNSRAANDEPKRCGSTGWGCGYKIEYHFCTCSARRAHGDRRARGLSPLLSPPPRRAL